MTEAEKKWIDEASYDQLLDHWRYAPAGDRFFVGDTGTYYKEIMAKRRTEVGNAAHVAASKRLG